MQRIWQTILVLGLLLAPFPTGPLRAQDRPSSGDLVERYREARAATMQAGSTGANVDAATELLADSVVYEHPRAGARIVGRAALGEGMRGFLGKTRRARIEALRQLVTPDAVAAEERVTFEAERGGEWRQVARTQLSVYEVREGRITRLIEYWQPD